MRGTDGQTDRHARTHARTHAHPHPPHTRSQQIGVFPLSGMFLKHFVIFTQSEPFRLLDIYGKTLGHFEVVDSSFRTKWEELIIIIIGQNTTTANLYQHFRTDM